MCNEQTIMMVFMPSPGDRLDRAILTTLQREGRIANIDLAEAVSLSPSACLRRVKALEAGGIIEGYRAEVSRARAGLGLTAFIGVRVESHSRATADEIERALTAIPAVVACYLVTGADDYMVEVAARDMADYEDLLLDQILAIPAVIAAHSTFAIRTVLSRGPVPLTHWR
jgi:Lrp/AsnC family transcriptional regulator, leucine-responsive regulatory protein